MSEIVKVKNLIKKFPGADALTGITLDISQGQIWGLLGPNGSGKSTLLKSIMGLVKPDRGAVEIFGESPSKKLMNKVAYLPEVDYFYRWMTINDLISFISSFYDDWQSDRANELLTFMNLDKDKKISTLSKGMRARLKLVVALARNADLVLLDEPLSGIDPSSRERIIEAIVSQFRIGKQTIILSTHEVLETEKLFDGVIFLDKGQVKLIGDAEALREEHKLSIRELFREVFL